MFMSEVAWTLALMPWLLWTQAGDVDWLRVIVFSQTIVKCGLLKMHFFSWKRYSVLTCKKLDFFESAGCIFDCFSRKLVELLLNIWKRMTIDMLFFAKKNAGCPKTPRDFPPRKEGILLLPSGCLGTPLLLPQSLYLRDGRAYADVRKKISRIDRLPDFLTHISLLKDKGMNSRQWFVAYCLKIFFIVK